MLGGTHLLFCTWFCAVNPYTLWFFSWFLYSESNSGCFWSYMCVFAVLHLFFHLVSALLQWAMDFEAWVFNALHFLWCFLKPSLIFSHISFTSKSVFVIFRRGSNLPPIFISKISVVSASLTFWISFFSCLVGLVFTLKLNLMITSTNWWSEPKSTLESTLPLEYYFSIFC